MKMSLFRYYDELQQDGVILYFSGPVSQSMVESIAGLMRSKMRAESVSVGAMQRVFSVLVEQMQNIVRYSSDRERDEVDQAGEMAHGQVVVGREPGGRFFVACGNLVLTHDCEELARQINTLRAMDVQELKAFYKERRRAPERSSLKGAGLGLVEMARKAVSPLDYHVVPVDGQTSFFSMKVVTQ